MVSHQERMSHYIAPTGEPCLRDAFVVFFDLLGTRGTRETSEATEYLRVVRQAVTAARDQTLAGGGFRSDERVARWFSDNLGIGYAVGDEGEQTWRLAFAIMEVAYLHGAFMQQGLLGRAGIAFGGFFADEEFIHGPALERAWLLEHTRAKYPRAVLDEASMGIARTGLLDQDKGIANSPWRRHLVVDKTGVVAVDYLGVLQEDPGGSFSDFDGFIAQHADVIASGLCRYDGVTGIEDKYRWLAGYHNWFVARCELEGAEVFCSRPLGGFAPFAGEAIRATP